jgi:Eukaryotic protein of unknown function (DUF1764)
MPKRKVNAENANGEKFSATDLNANHSNHNVVRRGLDDLDEIFAKTTKKAKSKSETVKVGKNSSRDMTRTADRAPTTAKKVVVRSRSDLELLANNEWADDGRGGKLNREGFTGRFEGGVKVFKAHLLNAPNFGQSKNCPFDCDCCFI